MVHQVIHGYSSSGLRMPDKASGRSRTHPHPTPGLLICDLPCRHGRYGSKTRVADLLHHFASKHDVTVTSNHFCQNCGYDTDDLIAANRHARGCLPPSEQEPTSQQQVGTTELQDDGFLLFQYPAVPSKCCMCDWQSEASGSAMVVSIIRHFFTAHGMTLGRRWKCSTCGTVGNGYALRNHRCAQTTTPGCQSINSSVRSLQSSSLRRLSFSGAVTGCNVAPETSPRPGAAVSHRNERLELTQPTALLAPPLPRAAQASSMPSPLPPTPQLVTTMASREASTPGYPPIPLRENRGNEDEDGSVLSSLPPTNDFL